MTRTPNAASPQLMVLGYLSRGVEGSFARNACRLGFTLLALIVLAQFAYFALCTLSVIDFRSYYYFSSYYAPWYDLSPSGLARHWDEVPRGFEAAKDIADYYYSGPVATISTSFGSSSYTYTRPPPAWLDSFSSPFFYLMLFFASAFFVSIIAVWRGGKPVYGVRVPYEIVIYSMVLQCAVLSAVMGGVGLLSVFGVMQYVDRTSAVLLIPAAASILCVLLLLDLRTCVRWVAVHPADEMPVRPFLPTK